ncbi:MAG TPA: hypothetical protein VM470_09845 [Acidimicrobiia bacterium]|nr:hypothetical protein [Acidimicrobiia bacterium]
MPALLRSRLAVAVLFGVFLIPVLLSSMRGLTHVVSCTEEVERPFQVEFVGGEALLTGSAVVVAGEERLCGQLTASMSVRSDGANRLAVTIPISNSGEGAWRGTVQLEVGSTVVPVSLGLVPAGESRSPTVILRLPEGVSSFRGSLLIGP